MYRAPQNQDPGPTPRPGSKHISRPTSKIGIAEQQSGVPYYSAEKTTSDPLALEAHLIEAERYGATRRGLKSRHIQLIALGGCIGELRCGMVTRLEANGYISGTGLFVGSGRLMDPSAEADG